MNRVLQDQAEFNVVFIHSAMDDAGLSPYAFRVYCHLARRANRDNKAWPGKASMAKQCCLSESSVQRALKELQARRMVNIKACAGGRDTNVYILTPPSVWTGFPQEGVLLDTPGGSEGHPKVLQEGNPSSLAVAQEEGGKKKGKEKPPTDHRHAAFIDAFSSAFEIETGEPYMFQVKDAKPLQTFLKSCQYSVDDLMRIVKWCWSEYKKPRSQWFLQCATIQSFCSNWPQIAMESNKRSS